MATCPTCGGGPLRRKRVELAYTLGGLPAVTLDGAERWTCEACGEAWTGIPQLGPLHRLLARALIEKPAPLAAEEIEFLTKWAGLEGVKLAGLMGVTPETVSRWRHGALAVRPMADRFLRVLAARGYREKALERLASIDDEAPATPLKLRARFEGAQWGIEPA